MASVYFTSTATLVLYWKYTAIRSPTWPINKPTAKITAAIQAYLKCEKRANFWHRKKLCGLPGDKFFRPKLGIFCQVNSYCRSVFLHTCAFSLWGFWRQNQKQKEESPPPSVRRSVKNISDSVKGCVLSEFTPCRNIFCPVQVIFWNKGKGNPC